MTNSDDILRGFIHLGKSEEVVEVLGFKIKFRTLETDEQTAVFDHCSRYADFARVSALRRETLIYAIETINDVPLEQLYRENNVSQEEGEKEEVSSIEKRRRILGKMDTEAINVIFAEHSRISEKRSKVLESLSKDKEKMKKEDKRVEGEVKNSPSEDQAD